MNLKLIEAAIDHITLKQFVYSQFPSDDEYVGMFLLRYPQVGIADFDGRCIRYTIDRQRLKSLARAGRSTVEKESKSRQGARFFRLRALLRQFAARCPRNRWVSRGSALKWAYC